MTQIISVITQEYALLASDRLLTFADGPRAGEVCEDDSCKLVNLCNTNGIGYSGLAKLGGRPTHEWIAVTLARSNCYDAANASQTLVDATPRAIPSNVRRELQSQTFLLSGWAHFGEPPVLRPHFCVVTNAVDDHGRPLAQPKSWFDRRIRALPEHEALLITAIGAPLTQTRQINLQRNLERLVSRSISPKEALRLLCQEIHHSHQTNKTIGKRLLAFCIPRQSVELQFRTGQSMALASLPNHDTATFSYFEPAYNELRQYGPTLVCGEEALTDVTTENDPTRDFQSAQMRFLHLPKSK